MKPTIKEQKWPDNIVIVRHGQSKRNVLREEAKATGGHADFSEGIRDQDTPLTPLGEMQALSVGVALRSQFPDTGGRAYLSAEALAAPRAIDVIYVSPYLRTRQTKKKIIEGLGYTPEIVVDERIREIEFGLLDGLSHEGIKAKYPEEVKRRQREGKYWYRAPGGESRPDVKMRLRSFIDTVVRDRREQNIVVVCHSVVVLALRALLERWGEEEYLQVDKENDVKNCSITHYAFNKSSRHLEVQEYNKVVYSEE